MGKTILIDTNLYLDDQNIIYKLAKQYDKILIPVTVLKELDKKKYEKDLSYSARNAIHAIIQFSAENEDKVIHDINRYNNFSEYDERILASAEKYNATVATKDASMAQIAKSMGLESLLHDLVLNNIYKPYIHVHMNDFHEMIAEEAETERERNFAYDNEYATEKDYQRMLTVFSKLAGRELDEDHWWFAIVDIDTKHPVIYANNPMVPKIVRIDNNKKYREIRAEDATVIRARDAYQVCAIYALEEAPHTLITGRWGSGKTLLATAHTLARSKKKAFITRAPLGISPKYDIGFLPGDIEDKLMGWLQGFMSALYYLYANTRSADDGNGGSYDFVREELFHRKFQIMPMNSIQGLSLLDNDTLIVDEAQLIDVSYMSMIMSRPSETGRLILLGDIKQTYDVVKPSESGLLKLLRVLPHKYMAYVELQNSYRSPLLELADKLIERSIG